MKNDVFYCKTFNKVKINTVEYNLKPKIKIYKVYDAFRIYMRKLRKYSLSITLKIAYVKVIISNKG